MGASGWQYYVPYVEDPREMLVRLHIEELDGQKFYWPRSDIPRPTALRDFYRMMWSDSTADEQLHLSGTHSILDIMFLLPAGSQDEFASIMPLTSSEVIAAFGTEQPSRAQFDATYSGGNNTIVDFPRWSGRYTTLYENDRPATLVLWGYSGD